jgi:tyrosine-protein kinase
VKSHQTVLTGDRLAQLVAKQPGLGLTAAEVRERIFARAVPDTVELQATVTDSSPARSRLVAWALTVQFKRHVESLETQPGKLISSVKVEVIVGPETADTPVSPRPLRNLALAGLLSLIVGVGATVLREAVDTTVKTAQSLQDLAASLVLAGVPFDSDAASSPLTVTDAGHCARAEALRQLRTNRQHVDVDKPVKTVVVTSAVPGEGKSSTARALAMLFAETGRGVLLLDADLRRPRIADDLGLEGAAGLTTVAEAFPMSPNDLLKHEIVRHGQRTGRIGFVLGGGHRPDDGIFRYKRSFDPAGVHPFRVAKIIGDVHSYGELVAARSPLAVPGRSGPASSRPIPIECCPSTIARIDAVQA